MIHISHHALQRFQERVAPCTLAEARAAILTHSRALEKAAAFGAEVVRCAGGERLILQGSTVVSVYAAHHRPRQCRSPYRIGGDA